MQIVVKYQTKILDSNVKIMMEKISG